MFLDRRCVSSSRPVVLRPCPFARCWIRRRPNRRTVACQRLKYVEVDYPRQIDSGSMWCLHVLRGDEGSSIYLGTRPTKKVPAMGRYEPCYGAPGAGALELLAVLIVRLETLDRISYGARCGWAIEQLDQETWTRSSLFFLFTIFWSCPFLQET